MALKVMKNVFTAQFDNYAVHLQLITTWIIRTDVSGSSRDKWRFQSYFIEYIT